MTNSLERASKNVKYSGIAKDLVVLIPVHDPKLEYFEFLRTGVDSIRNQTCVPSEILFVSNHGIPFFEQLAALAGEELTLRFVQSDAISAADNINFGVARSGGFYTKILFQDDFLNHDRVLENSISELSNTGGKWLVSGSRDWDEEADKYFKPVTPRYSERLIVGVNGIGAPSVVTFQTDAFLPMDNRLHYMFDCDWYLSMAHNFGRPVELSDIAVTIRRHPGQATSWAKQLLKQEKVIVKANHRKTRLLSSRLSGNCSCSQHL